MEFDPSGTSGDVEQIKQYDWVIEDKYPAPSENLYTFADDEDSKYGEGSPDNSQEIDNTYDIADTEKPKIKFHSAGDKNVKVTITYDDGWKDVTAELTKVITPVVQTIEPVITLDPKDPIDRTVEVQIKNNTIDENGLQYDVDWVINDKYALNNPDNPDKGNSETDNTVTVDAADPSEVQKHKFQSKVDHEIQLTVRFDNGWQRETKTTSVRLEPREYVVNAVIETSPDPVNDGFIGKIEVEYFNANTGDGVGRELEEKWTWNDKEGDTDHITERSGQSVGKHQKFTYQYVSRKPFSAVNGATEQNKNKKVELVVRYDNGWEDDKLASTEVMYEASPKELSSTITHEENVDGIVHGNDRSGS